MVQRGVAYARKWIARLLWGQGSLRVEVPEIGTIQRSGRGRGKQHYRDTQVPMQEWEDDERVDSDTGSEPEDTGLTRHSQHKNSIKKYKGTLETWQAADQAQ